MIVYKLYIFTMANSPYLARKAGIGL